MCVRYVWLYCGYSVSLTVIRMRAGDGEEDADNSLAVDGKELIY